MPNNPFPLDAALDHYGVASLEFLSPRDIAALFALRCPDYALDNRQLALCLFTAPPLVRSRVLENLNRFRRPRVAALLEAFSDPAAAPPPDAAIEEAVRRFQSSLTYAIASGQVRPPTDPERGSPAPENEFVRPRPWPVDTQPVEHGLLQRLTASLSAWAQRKFGPKAMAEAASPEAGGETDADCRFDVLAATPTEILRFWLPLHNLLRDGDATPLEEIFDRLDTFTQALAQTYLEDIDPDGFKQQGHALFIALRQQLEAYGNRVAVFFETLAAPTQLASETVRARLLETAPGLDARDIAPTQALPLSLRFDPRMPPNDHIRGLLTLQNIARTNGPIALERYAEDRGLGCPILRSGLIFFTTCNDPAVLLEIVRRKGQTMRREWERKASMLLTGFGVLADGGNVFFAQSLMEAHMEECQADATPNAPAQRLAFAPATAWARLFNVARDARLNAAGEPSALTSSDVDALAGLSDKDFGALLGECSNEELILSLANCGNALREKCCRVFNARSLAMIREAVNAMRPVRRFEVEAAQGTLLRTAHKLHQDGVIRLVGQEGGRSHRLRCPLETQFREHEKAENYPL
ncbi:MAG: flagellar motor switch protein [Solidesulfovibrio magneticus str. Maddingley MBC34]|uniref:Flagellar motor switch protein n=1 Tax=Solidesulfovibrio magneticus str. Maddingley MBC34 TaxID=1206767 RepID=K6GSJ9_9BACT|nr:MAG: flagellar motor switch protein [Solidesulfovibrio magneticus str. Maddingley MBC34]